MMEPKTLYEDKNVIVVFKPAGLLVHPGAAQESGKVFHESKKGIKTGKKKEGNKVGPSGSQVPAFREATLVDWLLKKYPEIAGVGDNPKQRPGIVHRLDKETSGVMVVARNQSSFEYLKSRFANHEIQKEYRAIVYGIPKKEEGVIDAPIGVHNGTLKRSVRSTKMIKEAVTNYKLLKTFRAPLAKDPSARTHESKEGNFSLLSVFPKTGRTHQIRVHLLSIGHAIVGDPLYGPKRKPAWAHRLMLHAYAIEFISPDGKKIKIETESPFQKEVAFKK